MRLGLGLPMADHPILFSGPMVRALLDGRKTQTRRVLNSTINSHGREEWRAYLDGKRAGVMCFPPRIGEGPNCARLSPVPISPGDRLWLREAWRTSSAYDDLPPRDMGGEEPVLYEANSHLETWNWKTSDWLPGRYRHARFMPRWASRLTLVVTNVRVQRLQEISEAEAWSEGCKRGDLWDSGKGWFPAEEPNSSGKGWVGWDDAREWFADLWTSLHGPDAWNANPWVAAYTFTVHRCNIDQMRGAT